tara:strand:+ start:675 stop:995 length:321 start_codon:yes stop_codon:yes gene_type:complete
MSEPKTNNIKFVVPDPSPDDDIYIDCKPVDENNVVTNDSYSGDDANFNNEMLKDWTSTEINIFDNVGFKSLLAVGIFAVILVSGNYVFNTIPNSRLQKAINKERFS